MLLLVLASGCSKPVPSTWNCALPVAVDLPARASGAPPGDGTSPSVYAITHFDLGMTDRDGVACDMWWQNYGFNLDNLSAANDVSMHCIPPNGTKPKGDGAYGRDNAFGRDVVPFLNNFPFSRSFGLQESSNVAVRGGQRTVLLELANLGTGSDYDPIATFALLGENRTAAGWLLDPTSISGMTVDTAHTAFPSSYLTKNTWVSGGDATIVVPILFDNVWMRLTIHHARLSMDLSQDHQTASNGTIAGVLAADELTNEFKQVFAQFNSSLCSGAVLDSIANQLRDMADIGADGTQNPNATCDGISIGIGFDAALINVGAVGPNLTPPNPCMPGG